VVTPSPSRGDVLNGCSLNRSRRLLIFKVLTYWNGVFESQMIQREELLIVTSMMTSSFFWIRVNLCQNKATWNRFPVYLHTNIHAFYLFSQIQCSRIINKKPLTTQHVIHQRANCWQSQHCMAVLVQSVNQRFWGTQSLGSEAEWGVNESTLCILFP